MRSFVLLLALFVVTGFSSAARADSFAFDFATNDGLYSGSGTFTTYPESTDPNGNPVAYSGYYISSLNGVVNGIPMVMVTGIFPGSSMDYYGPLPPIVGVPLVLFTQYNFLNGSLNFTLDGQEFFIHDNDEPGTPDEGLDLYSGAYEDPIQMDVIPTPEPATLTLSFLGLGATAFFRRKRKPSFRQQG
jgi:hypothetical protein